MSTMTNEELESAITSTVNHIRSAVMNSSTGNPDGSHDLMVSHLKNLLAAQALRAGFRYVHSIENLSEYDINSIKVSMNSTDCDPLSAESLHEFACDRMHDHSRTMNYGKAGKGNKPKTTPQHKIKPTINDHLVGSFSEQDERGDMHYPPRPKKEKPKPKPIPLYSGSIRKKFFNE